MCLYLCVHIYIFIYIYMFVFHAVYRSASSARCRICIYICTYVHIYMSVCPGPTVEHQFRLGPYMNIHVNICTYEFLCICTYVCIPCHKANEVATRALCGFEVQVDGG